MTLSIANITSRLIKSTRLAYLVAVIWIAIQVAAASACYWLLQSQSWATGWVAYSGAVAGGAFSSMILYYMRLPDYFFLILAIEQYNRECKSKAHTEMNRDLSFIQTFEFEKCKPFELLVKGRIYFEDANDMVRNLANEILLIFGTAAIIAVLRFLSASGVVAINDPVANVVSAFPMLLLFIRQITLFRDVYGRHAKLCEQFERVLNV